MLGDGKVAIEVKGSDRVDNRELRPLNAFIEKFSPKLTLVVCNESEERVVDQVRIIPWREFLSELWDERIIK